MINSQRNTQEQIDRYQIDGQISIEYVYGKDRWLKKIDRQIEKLDRWLRIDVVEQISTFIFAYNKKYGE